MADGEVKPLKYVILTDRGAFEAEGLNPNQAREQIEREHAGSLIQEILTPGMAKKRRLTITPRPEQTGKN